MSCLLKWLINPRQSLVGVRDTNLWSHLSLLVVCGLDRARQPLVPLVQVLRQDRFSSAYNSFTVSSKLHLTLMIWDPACMRGYFVLSSLTPSRCWTVLVMSWPVAEVVGLSSSFSLKASLTGGSVDVCRGSFFLFFLLGTPRQPW